jgi:protoporphyrinogen oxidase
VYLFVTLNKESLSKDQWIYFPSKEVPFGRVSEMRNFCNTMSPKGKTSLFIEFFCTEGDDIWSMNKGELFELSFPFIEAAGLFNKADVRDIYHFKLKNVYPVYDVGYREHAERVKEYLDSFSNMYAIGRPGRFRYNNQDHSLEMGILAARSIIEGFRHDIESVGIENEYYENGKASTSY